ncbi:antibiotic biosynthesis monooxygenase [Hymenobacter sp. YC55]|uniref:putative quinol monooxygenase n=1 Tax=Hymenobacter sp. YC55 TaxID=3034019 RepID=UPI0023F94A33|nr:antibiotic biosynthesis monooxygenase [Hymenobacter sp. YC55]MDF7814028.1 antibiotic biosynthesis monooxygenase [Hymenobacter sp. YC55]
MPPAPLPASDKSAVRHLLVTIQSQPEHRSLVQQLLLELVDMVRLEPGCLYYHLFQQAEDPAAFVLAAAWFNDEAVAAHPTPSQSQLVERIRPLLATPMQVLPIRRVSENPA